LIVSISFNHFYYTYINAILQVEINTTKKAGGFIHGFVIIHNCFYIIYFNPSNDLARSWENKSQNQGNAFSPSVKLEIRCWPKVSKHV